MWKRQDQTLIPPSSIGHYNDDAPAARDTTFNAKTPTAITTPPSLNQAELPPSSSLKVSMSVEASAPTLLVPTPKHRSGNVLKALPELPQTISMQPPNFQRPVSEVPTVSSLYSQPSPDLDGHDPYGAEPPQQGEVSPPDSPHMLGQDQVNVRGSPDVSPISATPSPTTSSIPLSASSSKRYASNLPLPKSTTKKFWKLPSSTKGSEDPESSNVRWDEYSGEPTAGDRGKPPSATPGSVKLRETSNPLRSRPNFGTSTTITSNNVPPRKRVGNREVADAPIIIRPEWKGAGGRHSIVKPLFDKPLLPHQSRDLPAGAQKRWDEEMEQERFHTNQAQRDRELAEQEAVQEAAVMVRLADERASQDQKEREREQQQRMARVRIEKAKREREKILHAQEESERRAKERIERVPVPTKPDPLRISPKSADPLEPRQSLDTCNIPLSVAESPDIQSQPNTPRDSNPKTPEPTLLNLYNPKQRTVWPDSADKNSTLPGVFHSGNDSELRRFPHPEFPDQDGSGSPDSTHRSGSLRDWERANPQEPQPQSWVEDTAIGNQLRSRFSATTIATTAYDTSPPRTPDMTSEGPSTATPDSILNRKRPVAPAGVIRRKPAPSLLGTPNSMPREDSKRLPKLPPDADATNPIQTLEAKVDVLRRRRRNLENVIEELTNVVQPTSIAYDRTSRAEFKKTLASLEKELSEVVKDEHDTGLRLLRAWRRHEDFAAYEPTMIWVRRVTH